MNQNLETLVAEGFDFTEDWFSHVEPVWDQILFTHQPSRILEIGSYEGRSTCYVIKTLAYERSIEVHCVDTWQGGIEHDRSGMAAVEQRFDHNVAKARADARNRVDLQKHKGLSSDMLARLLASGLREHFDLIYVDGSHQAPDVLVDAVLSFALLKVGGVLIFDDYVWSMDEPGDQDYYRMPKPAIDAFVNINQRKLKALQYPLYQVYFEKTAA